jgi:hypothetical protein
MTDRLISADALKKALRNSSLMLADWVYACDIVDKQPTAYNLESVLSELEELTDDASMRCDIYDDYCDYEWGEYNAHKEDLDIVRKGGSYEK